MTVKPIIFSAPMVRALLEGRKTQTRRVLKPQPGGSYLGLLNRPRGLRAWFAGGQGEYSSREINLRYRIGDLLWVRETWAPLHALTHNDPGTQALADNGFYRADCSTVDGEIARWRSSIHMPRWASRITLEVTGVKVEKLQDISEADARAEGIEWRYGAWGTWNPDGTNRCGGSHDPREAYRCLWININGAGSWEADPWVVAITFKVHRQNIDAFLKAEKREAA